VCYGQLRRLQYIHSCDIIHRDVKPSNIVMGVGAETNIVYLIDFGLSKEFRNSKTHLHIPYRTGLGLTGTTTFASINSHCGSELGRRDDLESLAYVLFYFLWGFLPWQGLGQDAQSILESKQRITTHDLFLGLPVEFRTFFEYCRSLSFDGKPNYDRFYNLFNNLLLREGFTSDMAFEFDGAAPRDKDRPGLKEKVGVRRHKRDYSSSRRTG
jgi:serine/threonine protein kinase